MFLCVIQLKRIRFWKIVPCTTFTNKTCYEDFLYTELKTLEWWISRSMLLLLFFLISRLNNACSPLFLNLQIKYPIGIIDIPFSSVHLETMNKILSFTNHIWAAEVFKFGLGINKIVETLDREIFTK